MEVRASVDQFTPCFNGENQALCCALHTHTRMCSRVRLMWMPAPVLLQPLHRSSHPASQTRGLDPRPSHAGSTVYSRTSSRRSDRTGRPQWEQLSLPMTSAYQVQFRSMGNIELCLPQPRFSFTGRYVRPVRSSCAPSLCLPLCVLL